MKITSLCRSVPINPVGTGSTSTDLTVVTTGNHNLVAGDLVSFNPNSKTVYTVLTAANSTTFTVSAIPIASGTSLLYVPDGFCYPVGLKATAGVSISYPLASSSDSLCTFQAVGKTSLGAGASGLITIQVSNDGVNWFTAGTISDFVLGTAATSGALVYNAPWGYVRASAPSITGTNGTVTILMGRNS